MRELEVLQAIWNRGTATVREVWEDLYPTRRLAYTTIATVMKDIEKKGYLTHTARDRTYVYAPTVGREDVSRGMVAELVRTVYNGSAAELVTTLIQHERLSEAELDEIQLLIDAQQREPDDGD